MLEPMTTLPLFAALLALAAPGPGTVRPLAASAWPVPGRLAPTELRLPARGAAGDREDILAVVQRLFDGMRTRDTALMRSAFLPGARLFGMRRRQSGETVVQQITEQQFAEFVARDTRAAWTERAFDAEVRVDGTLATVWAAYDFHFGSEFSHCGVDAVQLLKTPDGWKIVSIADTFQRTDCPARPAP